MKDVAETLRRVYQDPPARAVPLGFTAQPRPPFSILESTVLEGLDPFAPLLGNQGLQPQAVLRTEAMTLAAKGEGGWASWASGAKAVAVAVFAAKGTGRLEVPPLPRRPRVGTLAADRFPCRVWQEVVALARPRARSANAVLADPPSRKGQELMLSLPMAISGQDLRSAPKPVQMRCSLQMVKATGENVRNLDLLGRYLIPAKGVREVRHDSGSGRLLVHLGPEAEGAGRTLLLIARRKDDRSLLTCFPEEP
jgi:hypothetical protein